MTLQGFLQDKERYFRQCKIGQEILQSHSFLMSRNFETQVANYTQSNRLDVFLQIKRIVEQDLGNLFITPT